VGVADRIVELYGIPQLLTDIDKGRDFWRDGGGLIATVLDWVAGPGFEQFFDSHDLPYTSAQEFRQRHLIRGLRGMMQVR
jgi:hypothetical protein